MALNATTVVAAGADLAREGGVDAVGVRAVAGVLGVTPMALYRHVGSSDALHGAVIEALLVDLPRAGTGDDWQADVRAWAHAARTVFGRAPGLSRYVLLHWLD